MVGTGGNLGLGNDKKAWMSGGLYQEEKKKERWPADAIIT